MSKWSNVPGVFSVEVESLIHFGCEPAAYDIGSKRLPMLDRFVQPGMEPELIIEFKSSGYHQPMSMYGGADRLGWQEEHADDRELVRAYLSDYVNKREIELPAEVQQQLFEHYVEKIYETELQGGE